MEEQKERIRIRDSNSRTSARYYENFIREACDHGHRYTAASAVKLVAHNLHKMLGDKFDSEVFFIEIDSILAENNIAGRYFWDNR